MEVIRSGSSSSRSEATQSNLRSRLPSEETVSKANQIAKCSLCRREMGRAGGYDLLFRCYIIPFSCENACIRVNPFFLR